MCFYLRFNFDFYSSKIMPSSGWFVYKDHVTNEEVHRKIQAAIGEYDELLKLVKNGKLRWFGHVSRSSGLAKTILQGTVKGKRKQRQTKKKRLEDNIKE